ncbi:MAG: DEAD/DEAH box helicase [Puniceicoccales bacterium]|jgi:superfamily II DNA or RNA helicase|nr:DEAD/DEAH box helicase [Puniceicoccales bacterium]
MYNNKRPNNKYDENSLPDWREKMSRLNRNFAFQKDIMAKGRMVWAANAIKSIDLQQDRAKALVKYNGEDCTITFNVDDAGDLESESNLADKKICSIICAICIEIDLLLSAHPGLGKVSEPEYDESFLENKPEDVKKCLLVKFAIKDQNLVMHSFLDNDLHKPIFMQTNRGLSKISGDEKKISILRLLLNARKANFKFCFEHRDCRIAEWRDAVVFYKEKLPIWQKYFNTELDDSCSFLERGLIYIVTSAKVTAVDGSKIRIVWHLNSDFGEIDGAQLEALLHANGRPRFIENFGVVVLPENQADVIRSLSSLRLGDDIFPHYMLYFLFNQSAVKLDTDLKISDSFVECAPDLSLPAYLKDYQKNGVRWMRSVLDAGCQCLLADEMGLGKTLQTLSLICTDQNAKCSLIICPASVLPVWEGEIDKFFPDKTVSVLRNGEIEESDFILTSYNQARRLNSILHGKRFDYVILDEAQYIKNSSSKTARACCSVGAKFRIAITGTPIENNLNDVWSIFKFLMPGLLPNYRDFQRKIAHVEFRSKLRNQIAPFVLRRTKDSVRLQLPERNEIELLCPLNQSQAKVYHSLKEKLASSYTSYTEQASSKERMNILTTIMRMRQTTDCLDILPKKYNPYRETNSPKIDALMLKLEEIVSENKKVVIFSQFLGFLAKIESEIENKLAGCEIFKLTGATGKRKIVIDGFQNHPASAVMLISLKAGGVGITLHAAEYAFLMEPWWNPAVEEQAIARIHRIGQKKVTTIYRMIAPNTIEQHMRAMQVEKKNLFDEVIQNSGGDISFANFYMQNLSEFLK